VHFHHVRDRSAVTSAGRVAREAFWKARSGARGERHYSKDEITLASQCRRRRDWNLQGVWVAPIAGPAPTTRSTAAGLALEAAPARKKASLAVPRRARPTQRSKTGQLGVAGRLE